MNLARSLLVFALGLGCRRAVSEAPTRFTDVAATGSEAPSVARPCARCHPAHFEAWRRSQHASAQRPLGPRDEALTHAPALDRDGATALAVIGVAPLQQTLVARDGGRVQVFDPAWDPQRRAWFSIFGDAPPHPGAWSHWTGRGMNWNAQCATCHTTDFVKGYDTRADAYRSTWSAAGVACARCHGAMTDHAAHPHADHGPWRAHVADTCASCHARREELTGTFAAGERFDDHYRLTLADTPGAYHPDGRASDEDFEFASLAMSPMGQRGVTCLDCHDPHSGGLRVANDRDQLCLSCHAHGDRGAPVVAAQHAHHRADAKGARCVSCHMPAAIYMQRDRRRDHGFTIPDPALARATGAPDVCVGCHGDRDATWSEQTVTAWFGASRTRSTRARSLAVARATRGDATVAPELVALAMREENDAWRAALVSMLGAWVDRAEVRAVIVRGLGDRSPWVRAAAARALELRDDAREGVRPLRHDPVRAVRVEAAWSTRDELARDRPARAEVTRWIDTVCDQPAGALRRSELARVEGRAREARVWLERAVRWDPAISGASGSGR